jgi:hypothetical protein
MRETGILEELRLENLKQNPNSNFSVWDAILYDKVRYQPGLELILNCTCQSAEMTANRITEVTGWQMTTETYHTVKARVFIDCSGDAILAPLTGGEFRMGREGRSEYGESIAPDEPDQRTMGMSCLFQAREYDTAQHFDPPSWAYTFPDDDDLPEGTEGHKWLEMGYWWIELGGEHHSIRDTEMLRDELLKILMGVWDHIKNRGDHGAENWALEWIQFLPAKRESRRYIGDHVLTQNDIEAGGRFSDIVAYGGWPMDDHNPAGFWAVKAGAPPTVFNYSPSPYGIPYRSLYSINIENLMFAGRNASCSHSAMSSTRVMGTAACMGQAVGTAAAIAVHNKLSPREVGQRRLDELQQTLLQDDSYLPGVALRFPDEALSAALTASTGEPDILRDGINRPVGDEPHGWVCSSGDWAAYQFTQPLLVRDVSLIVNSALDKRIAMSLHLPPSGYQTSLPAELPRSIRLDALLDTGWTSLHVIKDNCSRIIHIPVGREVSGLRITLESTWGASSTMIHAFMFENGSHSGE